MKEDPTTAETTDPEGRQVVLVDAVWRAKIVRDHPEIDRHMSDVLRAVTKHDHVAADPIFAERTRYYARGVGPSRWLLVVVSYEQVAAPDRLRVRQPEGSKIMERVSITIGPLSFDHADYDAGNDVLYLHIGEPQAGEGEETPEGHVVRYAPGTTRIVGLTVLGARRVLERDRRLSVTVPDTVETTADELAPALAAV